MLQPRFGKLGAVAALWTFFTWASSESRASDLTSTNAAQLIPSSEPGWPQFRGLRRDGRSDERGLLQSWPSDGPSKLWSVKRLGQGYSSPIIVNDKIYITGDVGDELHLFCLDASKGKEVW